MAESVETSTTTLYVSDCGTRSIIVWNVRKNAGRRVYLPRPVSGEWENGPVDDDVFYTAMVEQRTGNYVYFTYLSGRDVYRTKTVHLRDLMMISPKWIVNLGETIRSVAGRGA